MSVDWRLLVTADDGTSKPNVTPADPIEQLPSFTMDSSGACISGAFSGLPKHLDIAARDIVTLEIDDGSGFAPMFKGYVTQLPSVYSDNLGTYELVGLKQRFYEIPVRQQRLPGSDVAAMVREVIGGSTLPVGVSYSSANAPDLDFTIGLRVPQVETVGDFLDELAAFVGRFIVPTGGSYTYDGTTYGAGDIVPAVRWGVTASGAFFFRRPTQTTITLREDDLQVDLDWRNVAVESAPNAITFVYGAGYDSRFIDGLSIFYSTTTIPATYNAIANNPPIALAMFRELGSGMALPEGERRYRRVALENPLDLCVPASGYVAVGSNWNNISDITDGDITTFAEATNASNAIGLNRNDFDGATECFVFVDYQSTDDLEFNISFRGWIIGFFPPAGSPTFTLKATLPSTDGRRFQAAFFVGAPVDLPPALITYITVTIINAPVSTRVYRLELLVPDVDEGGDLSQFVAEAFERPIPSGASSAVVFGLEPVAQIATVTPLNEPPIDLLVERIDYRLSTGMGLETVYQLGTAYDAGFEIERILLERLARRAVAEGGARR